MIKIVDARVECELARLMDIKERCDKAEDDANKEIRKLSSACNVERRSNYENKLFPKEKVGELIKEGKKNYEKKIKKIKKQRIAAIDQFIKEMVWVRNQREKFNKKQEKTKNGYI